MENRAIPMKIIIQKSKTQILKQGKINVAFAGEMAGSTFTMEVRAVLAAEPFSEDRSYVPCGKHFILLIIKGQGFYGDPCT